MVLNIGAQKYCVLLAVDSKAVCFNSPFKTSTTTLFKHFWPVEMSDNE